MDNRPCMVNANSVVPGMSTVDRARRSVSTFPTALVQAFVAQETPSIQMGINAPYEIGGSSTQPFAGEVTQQASELMHMGVQEQLDVATRVPGMAIPITSVNPSHNNGQLFAAEPTSRAWLAAKRPREVFEEGGLEHILWNLDEDGLSGEDIEESSGEFDDVKPVTGAPLPRVLYELSVVRVAQEFPNITDFRKVVADDAVKKKYEFRIVKSDPTRYTVKCKAKVVGGGCTLQRCMVD
ncbi:hypothetical protein CBR_g50904 [Chara braunii]|uniref:Transposase MuDR plant domain-containing protein n=1 Tax=Chara braunii TaxID=69332 RepID=A0A388M7L4_CHABU|nr:hypothetical protein CBR_g50904 [Chara braunii]|eukprot:GBG90561.1 hypothetical protein CBR_g50904 [Chara braunii]